MIGLDIMHHIHSKNNFSMALKLDMTKAFNIVYQSYFKCMLHKFNFLASMINILMQCVTTTCIVIRFNNTRTHYFKPSRGLRQRNPLSPFLFVLCMEGLSALILQESQRGLRATYSLRYFRDPLVHLTLSDDFILVTKATTKGIQGIQHVISKFFQMFGQNINLNKSKVLLSNSLPDAFCHIVCLKLGVYVMPKDWLYLGVLLPVGKKKIEVFQYLVHRLRKKVSGYGDHLLSKAEKLVMIELELQSLPTYVMSFLKLSKTIGNKLSACVRNFWWNSHVNMEKQSVNWINGVYYLLANHKCGWFQRFIFIK